ncbi:hypothetical protein [Mycobacteroides abscessus]|uniref:hypothetical protein n=1 Tax=Mycobacteroides abscessus TaxID=36809 RepID=UPI00078B9FD9|nr:hypothetical protein [Mycobacteroides abscessus]AMU74388.1 hypothetical protein A3O06_06735 [Mycobacteroides abscessus]ANO23324.1 hypothetical protein BAB79_06730 [Mycobacteroides abscessus]
MIRHFGDTRSRIEACNAAAYGESAEELTDWTQAERDQINALAKDQDRQIDLYPVVHAWRTDNGSGLTFWCKFCKSHHTHGRHGGPGKAEAHDRWDAEENWVPRIDAVLPLRLWRRYLQRFSTCKFNPNKPGGRGFCTCPVGSGDGHRAAHCGNRTGAYYEHGYILHEVEPNDARATRRPTRTLT